MTFNNGGSFVLESIGHPGLFLRHRGAALALEPSDGSADFSADASFFRISFDSR
ncbi:AbfB domain-containing protein [Devosia sp.]|uniref:AbfB domain-containing protein n=1 Tax=Devosia sp. TaxID=1871048 RepID=UPI00345C372C